MFVLQTKSGKHWFAKMDNSTGQLLAQGIPADAAYADLAMTFPAVEAANAYRAKFRWLGTGLEMYSVTAACGIEFAV